MILLYYKVKRGGESLDSMNQRCAVNPKKEGILVSCWKTGQYKEGWRRGAVAGWVLED